MGYILKTNNRKKLSGSTLQAKIVSPDKKDVVYREYPVEVQVQTLSDRECVLRDMQQLDAILSQNNDWTNVTKINALNDALQSASNGSTFILQEFVPNSDSNGLIIDSDGTIRRQPMYSTTSSVTDFATELHITVRKGEAREEYIKPFVIPAYTADTVLGSLRLLWSNNALWSAIKNRNDNPNKLDSNLTKVDINELFARTVPNQDNDRTIADMFDSTDPSAKPTLSMSYPNYYTDPLIVEDTNEALVTKLDAHTMYQLNAADYIVEPVTRDDLTPNEATEIGITKPVTDDKGEVVAYKMRSRTTDNNKITGSFSLGSSSLACEAQVTNVGFLSKKIPVSKIQANVVNAAMLSWFIPSDALTVYGINNTSASGADSVSSPKTITIPKDTYGNQLCPVLKISGTLLDMLAQETDITDEEHIGYSYEHTTNELKGFTNRMFNVKVTFTSELKMHMSSDPIDVTQEQIGASGEEFVTTYTAGGSGATRYFYLDGRNEFTSSIKGVITVELLQTSLGDSATTVTFYFELKPTP